MNIQIGSVEFLVAAAYIIIFSAMWRSIMYALRRNGRDDLAGAMAYLF
jgi:hypothetical protein